MLMSYAAQVAARKAAHPENYCKNPRCLWRTTGSPCPRHPVAAAATERGVYVAPFTVGGSRVLVAIDSKGEARRQQPVTDGMAEIVETASLRTLLDRVDPPVQPDTRPSCAWCSTRFTPNRLSFGVFCSRECGDAEFGAAHMPKPALSFHQVRRRLAELNLEGARPATATEQASFRSSDARSLR
jgi:ribosomal protein L37AE/L43A